MRELKPGQMKSLVQGNKSKTIQIFWFLQIETDYSAYEYEFDMNMKFFPLAASILNNSRELYLGNLQNTIQIQNCSKCFQCINRNIFLPHGDCHTEIWWHPQKIVENTANSPFAFACWPSVRVDIDDSRPFPLFIFFFLPTSLLGCHHTLLHHFFKYHVIIH